MATDEEQLVLSISADTRQILRAMKRLEGDISRSSAGIEKQFSGVGKAIDKAVPTDIQNRINKMVGTQAEATKEWTGLLANQGKEMERLRAKFSPMFATVNSYKSSIGEIRAAHRLGAISSDEMAAAIGRERQAALASIAAIKGRNAALADTASVVSRGGASFGKGANSFNTANIAAQFQDIGVMAQMGIANPLTIALQQGTQLSAVFNQMGGTRDIIKGIGAAFLQIINPVSLVTIGTIAAGVAAYNYFSASEEGAEATKKALKEQADLIARVAQKWGDALPVIRAYADEQDRIAGREDVGKAFEERYKETFGKVAETIRSAQDQISLHPATLLANSADPTKFDALNSALQRITDTAAENKTTVEDMQAAQAALLELFRSTGIPVFESTASAIAAMLPELAETNRQMNIVALNESVAEMLVDLQAKIGGISSAKAREELLALMEQAEKGEVSVKDLLAEIARISGYAPDVTGIISAFKAVAEAVIAARNAAADPMWTGKQSQGGRSRYSTTGSVHLPGTAPTPDARPNDIQRLDWDWEAGKKKGKSGGKAPKRTPDDRFFEDIEAIKQRTIALAEERGQLGLSYEAQQKRKTAFDLEQKALKDVREAARQKGDQDWQNAQLTPEQIKQIDEVSSAYARQAGGLKHVAEQRAFAEDALYGLFSDLVPAIETGNKALDGFIAKLTEAGLQALLLGKGPLGSGGGGGLLGAFLGSILPGYASGTANTGGRKGQPIGVVHGQEAVIPLPGNGKVPVQIQAPQAPRFTSADGRHTTTISMPVEINAPGADAAALLRVERSVRELSKTVPKMVDQRVSTRQTRNTRA